MLNGWDMFSCFPDDIKVDFVHIDNVIQAHLKVELQIEKLVKPALQQTASSALQQLKQLTQLKKPKFAQKA